MRITPKAYSFIEDLSEHRKQVFFVGMTVHMSDQQTWGDKLAISWKTNWEFEGEWEVEKEQGSNFVKKQYFYKIFRGAREACGGDSRSNASYRREKETSPTSYLHRYEASFPVDLEEFDSPQRRETAVSPREQRYVHDRHRARTRSDHAEYTDGKLVSNFVGKEE